MRLIPLHAALLSASAIVSPALAQEDEASLWRVFVADQATGEITALDLDAPDNRWSFEVAGPARLYPAAAGGAVIAVQSDDDQVDVLTSGIEMEAHGDHADIHISDPAQVEASLSGPRPFHVVTHDGTTAINFDRGGYAAFVQAGELGSGPSDPQRFEQAHAHHGFSVPFGEYVISSVASDAPTEGDELPPRVGIQAFTPEGEAVGEMQTCTDLHGEAISGGLLVAGCAEGIATARLEDGEPVFGMLPYPDEGADLSTGHLLGASAMQIYLGDYGDDAVVIVSPEEEPALTRVDLPYGAVDMILDPAKPQLAYILTEDGTLHRLDMLSAEIEEARQVVQPYSLEGHWRDPRPRLAVADDRIVLTDPREEMLRLVDAESFEETNTIPVEGLPYNIVAIGGSGLTH